MATWKSRNWVLDHGKGWCTYCKHKKVYRKFSNCKYPKSMKEGLGLREVNRGRRGIRKIGCIEMCQVGDTYDGCVLEMDDLKFVEVLREVEPYVCLHRGSTFVVVLSSQLVALATSLDHILKDIIYLHHLGIKLVLVPGTHLQIDELLAERGYEAKYEGEYRITDPECLKAAEEAGGATCVKIAAKLSSGPSVRNPGRHFGTDRMHDVGVILDCSNFLAAKKKGVIGGVDYGATGEVKKLDVTRIRERLDGGCIVMLNNLGHSSSGEVLNCNTYEVATACALAIGADKLICMIDGPILDKNRHLIRFLTLQEADMLIRKQVKQSQTASHYIKVVDDEDNTFDNGFAIGGQERVSHMNGGYLSELVAAAFVCRGGVQRVHLLDGTIDGVLLLELFKRDGMGTMVASDLYEGARMATETDLPGVRRLIRPLQESGTLVRRSDEELLKALDSYIIVEREGQIIACAALFPFIEEKCGEVAAIAVSPECRGQGQGHKLLDYIEKKACFLGLEMLFLLTTRTADWFVRRGFVECSIRMIPEQRQKTIHLYRNSKYYMKKLLPDKSGIRVHNGELLKHRNYFNSVDTRLI